MNWPSPVADNPHHGCGGGAAFNKERDMLNDEGKRFYLQQLALVDHLRYDTFTRLEQQPARTVDELIKLRQNQKAILCELS